MADHWTEHFSFVTGAVRYADLAYLALVNDQQAKDRVAHTFFSCWDGGVWRGDGKAVPWDTVSMCVCKHPLEQCLALGPNGDVRCMGSGDVHNEKIGSGTNTPERRGPLRAICSIEGKAYAVGMNRQVYRRDDVNRWTSADQGARPPAEDKRVVGFEAVDGFSQAEIYAAGWDGAIWRYDGKQWSEIDSPTNLILTCVCCAGDGNVYLAGQMGTLIRGRNQRWDIVEHEGTLAEIWGLAWFGDKLYLSTSKEVYLLVNDRLVPVDFGDETPPTCFHVKTAEQALWSIGAKDVMAFDGNHWIRID